MVVVVVVEVEVEHVSGSIYICFSTCAKLEYIYINCIYEYVCVKFMYT